MANLMPGDKLGPYEILAQIGAGGMGEVYQARDTRLDRIVAIKISNAQFSERFEREARAVAALNHPNICTLHDVGPDYLVMEYIEGEAPKGPLPLDEALRIARQIADALEAAHDKNITHRDLKPGNIKIKPDGSVKVLDFGLAKVGRTSTSDNPAGENSPTLTIGMTEAGMILGTAAYMAPEQARGKENVDKRADIWAFGVVLYELITGERLFKGDDVGETLAHIITQDPDLRKVPPNVRRLLKSCLEKDPRKRLRDIGDGWRMLEEAPVAAPASIPTSPRSRTPWMIAAIATVAALALGLVSFRHATEEPPRVLKLSVLPPEKVSLPPNSIPAVSPDGRQVAYAAALDGKTGLWVRDLSSLETRLLPGTDGASLPFWSPDSRSLGFFANGKLKKTDAAGGPVLTLCDAPAGRGGTWNKDDVIVFAPAIVSPLFRVPAAGGTPAAVTAVGDQENAHRYPWFLPDGRHFLYTAYLGRERQTLYVADLESKTREALMPVVSNVVYAAPGYLLFLRELTLMAQPFDAATLRTTGDAVPIVEQVAYIGLDIRALFSSSQNGVLAYFSSGTVGNSQLTWFDRSGKVTDMLGAPGALDRPAISPDGNSVAAARRDPQTGLYDLWLYNLARGTDSRFTFNSANNAGPVWSPDNSRIVFYSTIKGPTYLYQKPINGVGQEELLDQHSVAIVSDDWSQDGRYIIEQTAADSKRVLISGCCRCSVTRSHFPTCRLRPTKPKPSYHPAASGWFTFRTKPSEMKSTSKSSPHPTEANHRFPPTAASIRFGAATARNCITSWRTER
ncbi:MAG TPA: protein kinase [Bryobacteraceae bacterium]|nr:protein kinase [Bryobacteraceae bacterium]